MNKLIKDKFFDNINNYSLDYNQRKIIINKSKNILVVAGAGSGKTLVIIGKIKYLINKELINPKHILCISFTNETVNNLKNKLNENIDIYTFHKLSLEILNDHKIYYKIAENDLLEYIVNEYFECSLFYENNINYIIGYFKYYINDNYLDFNIIKTKYKDLFNSYKKNIIKFINLIKCNNYNLNKNIKDSKIKYFLIISLDIYRIYLEELNSNNRIDFDMMIKNATDIIKKYGMKRYYKYIIIDEFQDTSLIRYNLIKEIQKECDSNIFCVGDDFQSIYKFSGCTMDIFVRFKKYFYKPKVLYLNKTYRNSMELIKIAYRFIIKNHYQLSKILLSSKRVNKPIKIIYYTRSNYKIIFNKLLDKLKLENKKDILILGRCNRDIEKVYNGKIDNGYLDIKNLNIRYLTVHKAKGLEEENVIILNLEDDILGFPNKMEDFDAIKYFKNNIEKYPYAEERRLFYVAITRTKNNVYLMTNKNNISEFVKEIKNKCEVIE